MNMMSRTFGARPEKVKVQKERRANPVSRWFNRHANAITGTLIAMLVGAIFVGIPVGFTLRHIKQNHKIVTETAAAYHYKPNELAYCQSGEDDHNKGGVGDGGWLKCTVVSSNLNYRSYFVDYGGYQANISVVYMKRITP